MGLQVADIKDCNLRVFVIYLLFFLLFLSFNHYFNISSQRLKKLIKGKNAYIVPGMINANDDLFLANELGMEYFKCSFHKYVTHFMPLTSFYTP